MPGLTRPLCPVVLICPSQSFFPTLFDSGCTCCIVSKNKCSALTELYRSAVWNKQSNNPQDVPVPFPKLCLKEPDAISRSRVLFLQHIQTINHCKRSEISVRQFAKTHIDRSFLTVNTICAKCPFKITFHYI